MKSVRLELHRRQHSREFRPTKELQQMDFALSVLDVSPVSSGSDGAQAVGNTLGLCRLADRLGYERYWLAEHHNLPSVASSAPEVMIGEVASVTERIRVGAGGIMLPNHAPLKWSRPSAYWRHYI